MGRRSYLVQYFKEALKGKGKIHVANSSELSPAFQVADYAVITPLIYDKSYIPFLLNYCKKNSITAIISLFDIDLPILAESKPKFNEIGVTVIVSSEKTVNICNDKWRTYCFLKENDLKVPQTYLSLEEATKNLKKSILKFPVMIKPRWGMGSIAVYEAENFNELNIFYDKVKLNIEKTYLKYEAEKNMEQSVLIQEKLNGQEYGLDIINDLNGKYQTTIVKKKLAMRSGETDCAITVQNNTLKKLGKKISGLLKHIGNLDVDVFEEDNDFFVLEMNARFGGGYPFSHMAGVNLPAAIIKWLSGEKTDKLLLTERNNILVQKDISLVQLFPEQPYKIQIATSSKEVEKVVEIFEKELSPSLTERGVDLKKYSKKLFDYGKIYVLLDQDDKVQGMLGAYMNNKKIKEAYLTMLAVSKECSGHGFGKALLKKAEEDAKKSEMIKFKLEVRKANESAQIFYKKLGYRVEGSSTEDSIYMYKKLK